MARDMEQKKKVAFEDDVVAADEAADGEPSAEKHALSDPSVDPLSKKLNALGHGDEGVNDGAGDDDDGLDFTKLKKKKKKKVVTGDDADGEDGEAVPEEDGEVDFSKMKKKKKKKDTKSLDAELEQAGVLEHDAAEMDEDRNADHANMTSANGEQDYSYNDLLERIFLLLRENNPELQSDSKKKYTMVPPSVMREGNKKTIFANITNICSRMRRSPEHVIQFLFAELGTSGSVDGSSRLVIKGKFQQKQLENVLRRYIVEYVTCKTCRSPDTLLSKENRIYFMDCESCGSRRSVAAIKTGFQAHIGRRKKPQT